MAVPPFHFLGLAKPQKTYGITPDNSNTPFIHSGVPAEYFSLYSAKDWMDQLTVLKTLTPVKPLPLSSTRFTYIDTVDGLEALKLKLSRVDEFAVDLEANMYRSFQGLTCLMQISTRTEDFVVDTLKLHKFIRVYLGSLFLDPRKRKVMHGANNDVLWLQRDFGVYVCNLFDTMQASRVLKLERNSLEYLLSYYCGVSANKQYQTSDWRLRPLPKEMLHYAREDTHYLLYIYDLMRKELSVGAGADLLLEVYQKSHKVCGAKYEKELFTEISYKNLFGLNEAGLNMEQLNVAARLYQWRDGVARKEDESTGYVMPNKLLLEISQKMPETQYELLSIILAHNYPNHPLSQENAAEILKIISDSRLHTLKMSQLGHDSMSMTGYSITAVYPDGSSYQYYVDGDYPPHLMNPMDSNYSYYNTYPTPTEYCTYPTPTEYCTYPTNYYSYVVCS